MGFIAEGYYFAYGLLAELKILLLY